MCAYEEEENDVVMFEKNGLFIWHNLEKKIVLFYIVHVFIDVCDLFCRMADDDGPWYAGLIDEWDKEHRARAIENGKVRSKTCQISLFLICVLVLIKTSLYLQLVVAMRMRGHSADDFTYDPRYEPYIRRLGLLPFVLQFKRRAPPVNHAALTALVDRWRPETHSFHLPCGEMTMTLQDMAMISGLPINGQAVTGRVSVGNWRERTADLIGVQPEGPQEGKADTAKVRHSWLKLVRGNTNPCPQDANDVVVQQYARAYLWYVLTKVVFSDATGNSALWMFLELLNNWDTQYSWGSAALAYLYRQVRDICNHLSCICHAPPYLTCLFDCSLTWRVAGREIHPHWLGLFGAYPCGCGSGSRLDGPI